MQCESLFQNEINSFLSIEISAISLKYGLIKLFEEEELLNQNDLKQNFIRDCFLRNKKITYCLKPDPSWKCKNWGSKVQTALQVDSLHSQRMELHQATQLSDPSQREQERAMHRIGQKRESSSRRSYDESSGNRKIEKKMGCTEAETAKRLTIDELSFQEKESRINSESASGFEFWICKTR